MFSRHNWYGSGCGERYWGDFYGDPPDCCDPCDRCGNYIGEVDCWNGRGGGYRSPHYGAAGAARETIPTPAPQGRAISPTPYPMNQMPHPAGPIPKTSRRPPRYYR